VALENVHGVEQGCVTVNSSRAMINGGGATKKTAAGTQQNKAAKPLVSFVLRRKDFPTIQDYLRRKVIAVLHTSHWSTN